jgi:hypothetical protein
MTNMRGEAIGLLTNGELAFGFPVDGDVGADDSDEGENDY